MDVFFEKSEKQKCLEVPFRACPELVSGGFRGNLVVCGNSSVGRALASQAEGRGFEPRLPLHTIKKGFPTWKPLFIRMKDVLETDYR